MKVGIYSYLTGIITASKDTCQEICAYLQRADGSGTLAGYELYKSCVTYNNHAVVTLLLPDIQLDNHATNIYSMKSTETVAVKATV